jgi:RNA polymerase-binding transcription factor DksA
VSTAADRLLAERERAQRRLVELELLFAGVVDAARDVATDDEHDPEGQTIAYERQQLAALVTEARSQVREFDQAISRLADGRYGTCERCGREIPAERLEALPATSICVSCAP